MTTDSDSPLAALHAAIRADAQRLAPPDAAPDADAPGLPLEHPQRRDVALDDLIHVHQEAFVERAWRCLLKRAPEPEALLAAVERLERGDSKIALLGDLRWSAEGRRVGVHVRGLRLRYAFWRLTRVPLLGGIVERLALVAALPAIAREQRRLGQLLADAEDASRLGAEVRALRREVAQLRGTAPPTDAS